VSELPPELLRFDCPACGAVLTVPATIAGMQGPCPKCWQDIVSPDPARGLPARLPTPPPAAAPEPLTAAPPPVPEAPPVPVLTEDRTEPAADDETLPKAGADSPPARRSKLLMALGIGMPALALAALGYHFGLSHRPRVINASTLAPPALPQPAPRVDAPAPLPAPNATPPAPAATPESDAEAALLAFLGAPDWLARSAFVLSPDEIRPLMEKHAKERGDGPIPASSIQLLEVAPPIRIFKVCTPVQPDGFPVPVTLTDEGPKIDWEAFIGFHDDHFKKLLEGPVDQTTVVDLLVKPETGEEPSPYYTRYRLSVPMPGREATSWVPNNSVASARIRSVFDGAGGFDKATVDRLVEETGVPLRLALTKRRTNDGREFLEVSDLVAVGWARTTP
jgi:hypothetical protein